MFFSVKTFLNLVRSNPMEYARWKFEALCYVSFVVFSLVFLSIALDPSKALTGIGIFLAVLQPVSAFVTGYILVNRQ